MSKAKQTSTTKRVKHRVRAPEPQSKHVLPSGLYWPYITTAHGLVEALGGPKEVAKLCSTDAERVREWTLTGDIPRGWHFRLFVKAWALGEVVSPKVFAIFEEDQKHETVYSLIGALTTVGTSGRKIAPNVRSRRAVRSGPERGRSRLGAGAGANLRGSVGCPASTRGAPAKNPTEE
jgi:hypothetical protein